MKNIKKGAKKNIYNSNDIRSLYGEYLKHERGGIVKQAAAPLNAVIVFPSYYGIAMSNLGFLRAYELINASGFMSADRAFLQKDVSKGIVSIETSRRLSEYDLIFFSLSYENDFYNILTILEAEGIPFLSKDRNRKPNASAARTNAPKNFPIITAGGVIAFLNPEPVARIFDLMFIGEAEEIFPDFFSYLSRYDAPSLKKNKGEIIHDAGKIAGIYAPAYYEFLLDDKNVLKEIAPTRGFPQKIKRRWSPAGSAFSSSVITTEFSELNNINMIETARGCKRGCRFCSAGYIYLPLRESNPESVLNSINSMNQNEKAGFVGFDTMDNNNIQNYMNFTLSSDKAFSLSSVRIDCLDEKNLNSISRMGLKTVTLGIETGSERLKKLINKEIKNEEIISVVKNIIKKGIINIKSYFMVGLPYEEKTDLDETIILIKSMQKAFVSSSKINGKIGTLAVSFGPFVPKAWTPLQWENFEDQKILRRKMNYIINAIKSLPNLNIKINPVKGAYTEAFFARGSRLSLDILINSHKNKIDLNKAALNLGLDMGNFIRKFDTREILPWEIIDQGITKKYLLEEYKRGLEFKTTPQCFEGCKRCGIC